MKINLSRFPSPVIKKQQQQKHAEQVLEQVIMN